MAPIATKPLPALPPVQTMTAGRGNPPVVPHALIKVISPAQWEELVLEWAHHKVGQYALVELCAGARDMGRDVIAYVGAINGPWDNFQCKHYKDKLTPSEMWIEFAKVCYYTSKGEYTVPRRYYFVAPHGAGMSFAALLKDPARLKAGLIANWDQHCKDKITTTPVPLVGPFKAYVDAFDFSIFEAMSPLTLIDEHRRTPYYFYRFGGEFPIRPELAPVPDDQKAEEAKYVQALFDAYTEDHNQSGMVFGCTGDLTGTKFQTHFKMSREEFFSAEALRTFTRDKFPPGHFESLQKEVYHGVYSVVLDEHATAFRRVLKTTQEARRLPITGHVLTTCLTTLDRGGICHQLVNDDRLRWTQ
jgi:hypothetical protein